VESFQSLRTFALRVAPVSVLFFVICFWCGTAQAAQNVDLELVLAVDVSFSVDENEARLQREGYLLALQDPQVMAAISDGPLGRIALAYVEWAGASHQKVVVDWHIISEPRDAEAFLMKLAAAPISSAPYTSISALIDFSRNLIAANVLQAPRAVIDISGDGPNSDGRLVTLARDEAVAAGVTINGLPIISIAPNRDGSSPAVGVPAYYIRNVIGGPGAFALEVNGFDAFGPTLIKKLVTEIRGRNQVVAR
jgi:hypothetical protein